MPTITQQTKPQEFTVPTNIRVNILTTSTLALDSALFDFPIGYGNASYGTSRYGVFNGYHFQAVNATFKPVTFMRRP